MAMLWQAGVIDEAQFDALMALLKGHAGKTYTSVVDQIETELRKSKEA